MSDVLVIGATGRQGGAVARELAREGAGADPRSRLQLGSAACGRRHTCGGRRSEGRRIAGACGSGVDVVFAMTVMTDPPELEAEHGAAIVAATRAVGTPMLIYSSAALADTGIGIPSLEAKAQIERCVLATHPGNVVLGPAGFFDMVLRPESLAALVDGILVDGLPARRLDLGCDTLTLGRARRRLRACSAGPWGGRPLLSGRRGSRGRNCCRRPLPPTIVVVEKRLGPSSA